MLKFRAQAHHKSELRKFVYLFLRFKKVNLKIESFVKFLCVFGGCRRVKPQKAVLKVEWLGKLKWYAMTFVTMIFSSSENNIKAGGHKYIILR